jgi:NAD(P)-dependent dehydrogenase (short-subunit alcohol dehydrogenase family)
VPSIAAFSTRMSSACQRPAIDVKEFARLFTLNVTAQQALIAAFDPMLRRSEDARVIGLTSSVAQRPRAYWGAYGASKAAFEALLLSYAEEMRSVAKLRVAIVDPGATATAMRARAYPGEDATTLQAPDAVAAAMLRLLGEPFTTGFRLRVAGSARDQVEAV